MSMKNLQKYVGHIVHLRPASFKVLWESASRQGQSIENLFIVSAVNWKKKKLVCYGAHLCLIVASDDILLI